METLTLNPVEQIIDIYQSPEFWWVTEKIPKENLRSYLWQLVERGNLFWTVDDDRVVGIFETWKINYETLGKLVCNIEVPIEFTNTTNGNIAFVRNVWVDKDYRNSGVFRSMRNEFFRRNSSCDHYAGQRLGKHKGFYKSFNVSKLMSSLFRIGE